MIQLKLNWNPMPLCGRRYDTAALYMEYLTQHSNTCIISMMEHDCTATMILYYVY